MIVAARCDKELSVDLGGRWLGYLSGRRAARPGREMSHSSAAQLESVDGSSRGSINA